MVPTLGYLESKAKEVVHNVVQRCDNDFAPKQDERNKTGLTWFSGGRRRFRV